jgi:hypothetical protein
MNMFIGKEIFKHFSDINTENINKSETFYANAYFFGFIVIYSLSQGNPKAIEVLHKIQQKYLDDNVLKDFYCKLLKYKITGERLSYIYENNCESNVDVLINTDLSQFANVYFYSFY